MASVGVEFDVQSLDRVIKQSVAFYLEGPEKGSKLGYLLSRQLGRQLSRKLGCCKRPRWAVESIHDKNQPVRPWGLGAMRKAPSLLFRLSGETTRTPGMYRQIDPRTRSDKRDFLRDTNESVHSSVRTRLACEGLGLNDRAAWTCPALSGWRLRRVTAFAQESPPKPAPGCRAGERDYDGAELGERWVWRYAGGEMDGPADPGQRTMWEEPLGPYERHLLDLSGGTPNVYDYAQRRANRSKKGELQARAS